MSEKESYRFGFLEALHFCPITSDPGARVRRCRVARRAPRVTWSRRRRLTRPRHDLHKVISEPKATWQQQDLDFRALLTQANEMPLLHRPKGISNRGQSQLALRRQTPISSECLAATWYVDVGRSFRWKVPEPSGVWRGLLHMKLNVQRRRARAPQGSVAPTELVDVVRAGDVGESPNTASLHVVRFVIVDFYPRTW